MTRLWHSLRARIRQDLFLPPTDQFRTLNGMRGLSAYLVVCFHVAIFSGNFILLERAKPELAWFHLSINGFWVGLDVFFVLSGFLIGRILMMSLKRTGSVEFFAFFTRRSMRIFPGYYLILTLALFWYTPFGIGHTWGFYGDGDWNDVLGNAWQNYAYLVNYFFRANAPNVLSWGWSLCVEEHFYLFLPLLLTLIFRRSEDRVRPAWLWACMFLPLSIRAVQYGYNPDIVLLEGFYYRSHNRFDEVFYGVITAYYYVYHYEAFGDLVKRLGNWTWIIGLGLIASVWIFGGLQEQGFFAVVVQFNLMALGAAFVMINGLFLDNSLSRFFAHGFWYPIARVSYGIYLVHVFVLFWALKQAGFHDATDFGSSAFFLLFAVTMLGATLVAGLMFVCIERPLIDLGRRIGAGFKQPPLLPGSPGAAGVG